jgi:hypothetical protein
MRIPQWKSPAPYLPGSVDQPWLEIECSITEQGVLRHQARVEGMPRIEQEQIISSRENTAAPEASAKHQYREQDD